MDELVFNGKKYMRHTDRWTDENYVVVPEVMQRKLNERLLQDIDFSALSVNDAVKEADKYKRSGDQLTAIKCYEVAISKGTQRDIAYIIPRISSCYRAVKMPEAAIQLLSDYRKRFGTKVINAAMFTSAAAAYCDMGKWEEAKKCIDRAYAMGGSSREISAVYHRIEAKSDRKTFYC